MSRILGVAFVVGLLGIWSVPAHAWWNHGHAHITEGAVDYLPQPLRSFFEANVTDVRDMAAQEPPGKHYIDIDYYPEFFTGTFPRDVDDLIALYGYSVVYQNGQGPWTYAGLVEFLSQNMAAAKTYDEWLDLIPTMAAQAHYIEDLHNPLHLTQNYNGQLTGNFGIHARYEGEMILRHLNDLTFAPGSAVYQESVIDDVFDEIDVQYYYVDDIMAADDASLQAVGSYNEAYYTSMWSLTGDFTHDQFQLAAEAVANGWYTAWVDAGSPVPNLGLKGDYNGDNVVDAGDYTVWRDAMATPGAVLMNDATPESVSDEDYDFWRASFGMSIGSEAGAGAGAASAVPEPATAWLLLIGMVASFLRRRLSQSSRTA